MKNKKMEEYSTQALTSIVLLHGKGLQLVEAATEVEVFGVEVRNVRLVLVN